MSKIKINSPIWKSRSIGIAEYAMKDEDLIIDILYIKKRWEKTLSSFVQNFKDFRYVPTTADSRKRRKA